MATQVIKRDGSKQPFDAGKMRRSIEAACKDVELSEEQIQKTTDEVFGVAQNSAAAKEEIATSELKQIILGELDRAEPMVSAAWRRHDEQKKS